MDRGAWWGHKVSDTTEHTWGNYIEKIYNH